MILYQELGHRHSRDPNMWSLYPKHHLMNHCAGNRATNPASDWNYGDETEIGRAAEIAAKVSPVYLSRVLIERYRATFDFLPS